MPQTAKEQATFILCIALGMGFILFLANAFCSEAQYTNLLLDYRERIRLGTEQEATEALEAVTKLRDHNVPALVEALASTRPRISAAAAHALRGEVATWENMSTRSAAAKFQNLAEELEKELANFSGDPAKQSVASELATRVVMWKGLDGDPAKPQILEACNKVLKAGGKTVATTGYANTTGGSYNNNPYATNSMNPYDDNRNNGGYDSRNTMGGNSSSFGQRTGTGQPTASIGSNNGGSLNSSRGTLGSTTHLSQPNSTGFGSHLSSNPYATNTSTSDQNSTWGHSDTYSNNPYDDRRDVNGQGYDAGSDIVHRSQLPGGNLPVSTNNDTGRSSATGFSIPSASINGVGINGGGNNTSSTTGTSNSGRNDGTNPFSTGSSGPAFPSANSSGISPAKTGAWPSSSGAMNTPSSNSGGSNNSASTNTGGNSLAAWGGSGTTTGTGTASNGPTNPGTATNGAASNSAFGTSFGNNASSSTAPASNPFNTGGASGTPSGMTPVKSGGATSSTNFSGGNSTGATLLPANSSSGTSKANDVMQSLQNSTTSILGSAKSQLGQLANSAPTLDPNKMLQDPNPATREQLANTIMKVQGVDTKAYLLALSKDTDPNVRFAAAGVMATSSDPDLTKRVADLTTDTDPRIQAIAQRVKSQR